MRCAVARGAEHPFILEKMVHPVTVDRAQPGAGPRHATSGANVQRASHRCADRYCLERRAGLLVLWWQRGSLITRTDVLGAFDALRELSDGEALPLVEHLHDVAGFLPDARDALTHYALSSRVALVGGSPVDRVIAAFAETGFTETRYFECADAAEAWARAA